MGGLADSEADAELLLDLNTESLPRLTGRRRWVSEKDDGYQSIANPTNPLTILVQIRNLREVERRIRRPDIEH